MPQVTAVALLVMLSAWARGASWSSSDELRRRATDQDPKIFRAVTDRGAGDVQLCAQGTACREAFDGRPLREGDVIKTGPGGHCDVVVENAGRLRVLENTELKIAGKGAKCSFKVVRGSVLAALDTADCDVVSPQASAATRGSRFRLDFNEGEVARFVVSDSVARLIAGDKPRALRSRWWAGKAPVKARVLEDAAGTLARRSGATYRGGAAIVEGDSLEIGDVLETPENAWASVALSDGFAAVLDASTRVSFGKKDGRWALNLLKGRVYIARLRPGASLPPLVLAGSSTAYEGSDEFEAAVADNSALADFAVFAGRLVVRSGPAR